VMRHIRAPSRALSFSRNAQPIPPSWHEPGFAWLSGSPGQPMRFETLEALRAFGSSDARLQHNFVFTNTREGWFFSACECHPDHDGGAAVRVGERAAASVLSWG
jgi:hypothetical protein